MTETGPVTAYAPATVANLGPGYDIIGLAVVGLGDRVTAERTPEPGVVLDGITGDGGQLPTDPASNTTTVAANDTLRRLEAEDVGIRMTLHKGLPLGSGLGSSAASAVAGALVAARIAGADIGDPEIRRTLLEACCEAEKVAAGVGHADNVGPSLFGGVLLIRRYNPIEVIQLPTPANLRVVVVMPAFSISTREARNVLPESVRLADAVSNAANVAAMVAGFYRGDLELIGRSMDDAIVEPVRGAIIPGFKRVKRAALDAGALGCTIAGAGPTCFAIAADDAIAGRVGVAMEQAWTQEGIRARTHIGLIDHEGARIYDNPGLVRPTVSG